MTGRKFMINYSKVISLFRPIKFLGSQARCGPLRKMSRNLPIETHRRAVSYGRPISTGRGCAYVACYIGAVNVLIILNCSDINHAECYFFVAIVKSIKMSR